ncbi:MAG: hypothetical protein ACRD2U_05735 [Terriglobales bacterium]
MNAALIKALIALVPASLLLFGSVLLFVRRRAAYSLLQLIGSGCLTLVVVTHICEALLLFPAMGWGYERSIGHYLDLCSAVLGLTLFPVGYLLCALRSK